MLLARENVKAIGTVGLLQGSSKGLRKGIIVAALFVEILGDNQGDHWCRCMIE